MSFLFPSATITFEAALRDLASGSGKARVSAAHALGDIEDPTERARAVEALVIALDDDLPEVRMEACAALGALSDVTVAPHLIKRLDDGAAPVRQHAAIALGTLRAAAAFDALASAAREGPPDLRYQAITSLAEIDATRAFDAVVEGLRDPDPQVACAAALALGTIGDPRGVSPLVEALTRPEPVRFDAAYALADLGDPRGLPALVEAMGDPERAWDAVTAIARIGGPDAAAALARALGDRKTPPEASILAAGRLLLVDRAVDHAPRHDGARRVLLAGLELRKEHLRGLAIEQLAEVGGAWARGPLEKLAGSSKGGDHLEGIAAALRSIGERDRA